MSQLSHQAAAAAAPFRTPMAVVAGATLKRLCMAYMMWRLERLAIAQLRAFSDRELEDIGLARAEIPMAVKSWITPCSALHA